MSRGKSTCKVLKEVRLKIADANGIPLEERECTHKGDCAGTCPYCEAEVCYLERELSKRISLGKAVAVAGIALSAVTMAGCATSEPVSTTSDNQPPKTSGRQITDALSWMGAITVEDGGKPKVNNPEKSKSKKGKKSQECDTIQVRGIVPAPDPTKPDSIESVLPDDAIWDGSETPVGLVEEDDFSLQSRLPKEEFVPKSIPGYKPPVCKMGEIEIFVSAGLAEFQSYMMDSRLDEVEILFFVEDDGSVSTVNVLNMPEEKESKDDAFCAKVTKVISHTGWLPATVSGKPVSALITLKVRDLR